MQFELRRGFIDSEERWMEFELRRGFIDSECGAQENTATEQCVEGKGEGGGCKMEAEVGHLHVVNEVLEGAGAGL